MSNLSCFKAYDIRGRVPQDLSPALVYALGRSLRLLGGKRVVIGHDARISCPMLVHSLMHGLAAWGADIFCLGLCGTEEIYHAAANGNFDIGLMVTGSHNPPDENGFKIVRSGAIPVSADSGLKLLKEDVARQLAENKAALPQGALPDFTHINLRDDYIQRIMFCAGLEARNRLSKKRVVVDCGNGCAGPVLEKLAALLPFEFVFINANPDGNFPNGVPNPLLPEMRSSIARAVVEHEGDIGIAFDGDFDRCFFLDSAGNFVNGAITASILARRLLALHPGQKIIHDTRLYWHIQNTVQECGGLPIMSKCGHAFIKERMRQENALFGGEASGHYFFRDFSYCDSGMIAMLLMLSFLLDSPDSLTVINERMKRQFPAIDEKNFRLADSGKILEKVWQKYAPSTSHCDRTDGINLEFPQWRFNLRASNTESLVRLNLETRGDNKLLADKYAELAALIEEEGK